jgi:hypothetical protein
MLAVATSIFNCKKDSFRHRHYETFRNKIKGIPVFTVELAFDELPFVLEPQDNLLQIRCNTWMWQRDRIVNELIKTIPAKYDNIALIDADILFHDNDWPEKTEKMLSECLVGQMWENCFHSIEDIPSDRGISNRDKGIVHTGYAWAARRSFLDEFGLFDKSPVGGNDVFMTCAYCGWTDHPHYKRHTPTFINYFKKWATKVFAATKGDVGYIESDITHLWHGFRANRNYIGRIDLVKDFDPTTDIELDSNGCWKWATDKPELHKNVADYMKSRMEG